MFPENDSIGDVAVSALAALGVFIMFSPFILLGILFVKTKTVFYFTFFNNSSKEHASPPLNPICADIFRKGLEVAVKAGKVQQSTIREEEV